jgi:TatD DNase family protein
VDRALSRPRSFVSFGPAILYSKKLLRIAKRCPPETVLAESDGPVAFAALGGAEGPGLIPSVALKLAELWGKSLDEAALQLSQNAESYLR